jgi:hypothetical protein
MASATVNSRRSTARRAVLCILFLILPGVAQASLLSPEAEDKVATILALFILFFVPVVLIVLFWLVHILPERIAHQRHHPQFEAIRTLCLLSLLFGGLLWPLAWVWAYSKPVLYKLAYGADTAPATPAQASPAADSARRAHERLHQRLNHLGERIPEEELAALRAEVDALETALADAESR